MPTSKPRIQVTLAKSTHRTLAALAKRHFRSMSSLAAEMLDDMLPLMSQALNVAASMRKLSPEDLAARKSQMDLWTGDAQARLDALERGEMPQAGRQNADTPPWEGTETVTQAVSGARQGDRPAAATPPSTNRGVKTRA